MKRYGLWIMIVLVLAACAKTVTPTSTPLSSPVAAPTSTTSTTVTSPLTPPDSSTTSPLATPIVIFPGSTIEYQREGGITGKSEKWTIYPTGRIVTGDGAEWQVPVEQVKPLFDLVEAPGFWVLKDRPPTPPCADCYTHTLTLYQEGAPKTITFIEGANLSADLQQLLAAINQAISR